MAVDGSAHPPEDPRCPARAQPLRGVQRRGFAIALTLLIVETKVPGSPDGPHGYGDLARAMARQWREHLTLVICYVVLGAYWLQHHYSGRVLCVAFFLLPQPKPRYMPGEEPVAEEMTDE
jgi:hypothetical protein